MVACEAWLGKLVIRSIDQQWMDRRPSKKPQATFRFGYPTGNSGNKKGYSIPGNVLVFICQSGI